MYTNIHLPVSDLGSLARDPSLLMVLMTKFFSRVKLVRPTDSELSMTKTMSRAPQRFSQSDKTDKTEFSGPDIVGAAIQNPAVSGLTTAATGFPDVVHHIAFLVEDMFSLNQSVVFGTTAIQKCLMFSRSGQDLLQVQDLPVEEHITF